MTEQTGDTLASRLKSLRQQRGLQVQQLARNAGVSEPYLSQLEGGTKTNPSADVIDRLAKALDVSAVELARGSVRGAIRGLGVIEAAPLSLSSAYKPIYYAAFAAERLSKKESQPESVDVEIPPPEYRDQLGPDPIGVIIDGDSLAGIGIRSGMVAWVNTTDFPYYVSGDVVLANVRERDADDLKTVIKQVRRENGRQALYSVRAKGQPEVYEVEECWVLAKVVCIRERTPVLPRAFRPGLAP